MKGFSRCARCGVDRYPNQLKDVEGYLLCTGCVDELLQRLSCKQFMASMIKSTMPMGEIMRMRRERAKAYAGSDVMVGAAS